VPRPGAGFGFDEVVDRTAEKTAIGIAQQVGQALVDIGDHTAVIGHPDPLLGHVHQLLEPLLALLQRAGALLQPCLATLERGGVTESGAHQAAQQPKRLGIPVGECAGVRGHDLEDSVNSLLIPERQDHERAHPETVVLLMLDPRVGQNIVASL
jgi:hypothetical protein